MELILAVTLLLCVVSWAWSFGVIRWQCRTQASLTGEHAVLWESRTKAMVFSLLLVPLSLVVWLCCLWLPPWWGNFVSVALQLILMLGVPASLIMTHECCFCLALLVAFVPIHMVLVAALQNGSELPMLLQPLDRMELTHVTLAEMYNATFLQNITPKECQQIAQFDIVKTTNEGETCAEWCHGINFYLPTWLFIYPLSCCLKAEAWLAFSFAMQLELFGIELSVPIMSIVAAVLYILPALWTTWRSLPTSDGYDSVVPADANICSSGNAEVFLDANGSPDQVWPSSEEPMDSRGPFRNPGSLDLQELFCKMRFRNDMDAAIFCAKVALVLNMLDVFGDMNSSVALLALGQPFYGLAMLASIVLPNLHDIFQRELAEALAKATRHGMTSVEVLRHQKREGVIEGGVSCLVAVCALVRTPDMTLFSMASLSLTVFTSVAFSLPTGRKAQVLLQTDANFNNYYEVCQVNKKVTKNQKYIVSALVMSTGCSCGLALCAYAELHSLVGMGPPIWLLWSKIAAAGWALGFFLMANFVGDPVLVACLSGLVPFWILHWTDVLLFRDSDFYLTWDQWRLRQLIFTIVGSASCLSGCFMVMRWRAADGWVGELRGLSVFGRNIFACPDLAQSAGRFYYEVEFLGDITVPKVGFLNAAAKPEDFAFSTLGSNELGWAFNGTVQKWQHNSQNKTLEMSGLILPWERGDIVGIALDFDEKVMRCHSKGSDFTMRFEHEGALYPAMTVQGFFRFHLAKTSWKLQPPQHYQQWGDGDYSYTSKVVAEIRREAQAAEPSRSSRLSFSA